MNNNTIEALLVRAATCEAKCVKIYAELATMFTGEPLAVSLWESLSRDESHHVKQIQDIQHSLTAQELSSSPTEKQWKFLLDVENFLNRRLLSKVDDLDDAYELAHEIENYELITVFRLLAINMLPKPKRDMFLKPQLNEHLDRLKQLKAIWPSVAARKTVRCERKQ